MSREHLSDYTSFGIGGEAEIAFLTDRESAVAMLEGPHVVLGRGTNVLVSDEGVSERVVVNRLSSVTIDGERVYADSGVSVAALCAMCCARSLSGLEWACGIPGSLGGAITMNAGACGGCMADVAEYADVVRGGGIKRLSAAECAFTYRGCGLKKDDFVLGAGLRLSRGDGDKIAACVRALSLSREARQPKGRSAGSVYLAAGKPAGWYIERAGLKGERVGGAEVSPRHANFIVNTGSATAADVYALMLRVEKRVFEAFGVKLQREIKLIGDFG